MKILTVNFLTCAIKACKSSPLSFPLHFKDAELEQSDIEYNLSFLQNILPRIDWDALKITANEVRMLMLSKTVFKVPVSISGHSFYFLKMYAGVLGLRSRVSFFCACFQIRHIPFSSAVFDPATLCRSIE